MSSNQQTIVAVSSPPGRSLRGLVRLSGPSVESIIARLRDPACTAALQPRQLQAIRLQLAVGPLPALAVLFKTPHSYTGQDMLELQLPGNPALLEEVLKACVQLGARLAEPGEFTLRAFLAGKLDLTQAEGIAATITARSDAQLQAAQQLREGELGKLALQLVDQLAAGLALVEAGIDFTDQEDVTPISPSQLVDISEQALARLDQLLAQHRSWSQLEALPRVVLAGLPSAGKSTLFNALLGHARAVTHAMPGTTRDVLAEPLPLRDARGLAFEVMLIDLAGLDQPQTALDEQVQHAARQELTRADLVLAVSDSDQMQLPSLAQLAGPHASLLRVRTKIDLHPPGAHAASEFDAVVSAQTGIGLDSLRLAIARQLASRASNIGSQMIALAPRHEACLQAAADHLRAAQQLLAPQRSEPQLHDAELIAGCLRSALDELAALGGQVSPDDVIGRVFATFCIGK